jgi:hypothetical protein
VNVPGCPRMSRTVSPGRSRPPSPERPSPLRGDVRDGDAHGGRQAKVTCGGRSSRVESDPFESELEVDL